MESTNKYEVEDAVEWLIKHAHSTIDKNKIKEVTRISYYRDHWYGSYDVRLYCKDETGHEDCRYEYSLTLEDFHAMMKYARLTPPYSAETTIEIIQMGEYNEQLMRYVMDAFSFSDYYFEKMQIEKSRLALVRYDHVDYAMKALRHAYEKLFPDAAALPLDVVEFSYSDITIRMAKRSQEAIDHLFEEKRKKEEKERLKQERIAYCKSRQHDAALLIIPDVHGRYFWKDAVEQHNDIPVVFLCDYLDPYHNYIEDISVDDAICNFKEILDYKHLNSNRVTLLLGNHDIHYIASGINCSRKDSMHADELHDLFVSNLELFKLAANYPVAYKMFVMTHAGILKGWLSQHHPNISTDSPESIVAAINASCVELKTFVQYINDALMEVPFARGGGSKFGSIVWADESEHMHSTEPLPNIYQVFGHTQRLEEPLITNQFANLDCRKAFIVTNDGEILEHIPRVIE